MTSDEVKALLGLAERCEKATGPDFALDCDIARAMGYCFPDLPTGSTPSPVPSPIWRYTASLDAAMTLVPEGWRWIMREAHPDKANRDEQGFFARLETRDFESVTWGKGSDWLTDILSGQDVHCWAATPALALCAAALRARASIEGATS